MRTDPHGPEDWQVMKIEEKNKGETSETGMPHAFKLRIRMLKLHLTASLLEHRQRWKYLFIINV